MKTQSAKAKGRKLQQHVAQRITEEFELHDGDVESRPMGSGGADIMMSSAARKKFPFSVECKNTKTTPGKGALSQAKYNTYKDTLGIVVWKPFRASMNEAVVMISFEDLLKWWKEINGETKEEER